MEGVTCHHIYIHYYALETLEARQGQCEFETQLWLMSGLGCRETSSCPYHSPHAAAAIDHFLSRRTGLLTE